MTKKILLALLSCVSLATVAADGKRVEISVAQQGYKHLQAAYVVPGYVVMPELGGNADRGALYNQAEQSIYIFFHDSKDYYRIDNATVDKMKAAASTVAQLSAGNGALAGLLGDLGVSAGENKVTSIDTKKQLDYSGISCQVIQTQLNDEPITDLCFAKRSDLSALSDAEYNTLSSLYQFSERALNEAGKVLDKLGVAGVRFSSKNIEGLPIAGYSFRDQGQSTLAGMTAASVDQAGLDVPQGYVQRPLPFIGY